MSDYFFRAPSDDDVRELAKIEASIDAGELLWVRFELFGRIPVPPAHMEFFGLKNGQTVSHLIMAALVDKAIEDITRLLMEGGCGHG